MTANKFFPCLVGALLASSLLLSGCSQFSPPKTSEQTSATSLIPIAAFFDQQAISNISLSPDGQWIAFFKELDGIRNIFLVAQYSGVDQAVAITEASDPIASFRWAKTGNKLFFLKDDGGNENTQIYRLTFDPQSPSQNTVIKALTDNPKVKYKLLEQVKDHPMRLVVMANHDNEQHLDVYHLDTSSGELTRVAKNQQGFSQFKFNAKGQPLIAISSNPDNSNSLYIQNKGQWQVVFRTKFGEDIDLLEFDDVTRQVYVRANIEGRDKQELLRLGLATHTFYTIHKDPNNQSDLNNVLFNDNGQPIATIYYGGHQRTYPLNNDFAIHWDRINKHFGDDVEITIESINEKTKQWQVHIASDVTVESAHRYNAETGEFHPLLAQPAAIEPHLLSKRQSITYLARDGVEIQAYLTLPKNRSKNLPTIILPHGGPWARDYWTLSSNYFNPIAQLLANRGYAVLQPNFRASLGFGKHFVNLGNKNWGTGGMQHDLTDGVNYLIAQGIANKNRVGIMGASYGGYAALAGITYTPDLYKAAVSYVGPSSLITLLESFPAHFRPYLGQFYSAVGDPLIEADRIDMHGRSPINFVKRIKTPLLLVQGANDPRVTKLESDNIAKVMNENKMAIEYILAEDEGHGFQKRNNKLAYIIAMERFFAKHLGGRVSHHVETELEQHLATLKVDINTL